MDVAIFFFQAKLDDFSDPLHQRVEIFCLGMAALQRRNRADVIACLVALDQDGELSFGFRGGLGRNLPRAEAVGGPGGKRPLARRGWHESQRYIWEGRAGPASSAQRGLPPLFGEPVPRH